MITSSLLRRAAAACFTTTGLATPAATQPEAGILTRTCNTASDEPVAGAKVTALTPEFLHPAVRAQMLGTR